MTTALAVVGIVLVLISYGLGAHNSQRHVVETVPLIIIGMTNCDLSRNGTLSASMHVTASKAEAKYWVSWGDGKEDGPFNGSALTHEHVYAGPGTYQLSIRTGEEL